MENPDVNSSISNPDGILASIFRQIKRRIPGITFAQGLERYLNRRPELKYDIKKRSSDRGNLKKQLDNSELTWKVFIKGLDIIGTVRLDISFKITSGAGKTEEYTRTVLFNNPSLKSVVSENKEHLDGNKPSDLQ